MKKGLLFLLLFGTLLPWTHAQDFTVNAFADAHHTGANTINQNFTFPSDVSMYDSITMNVALTCPPGGCDPWDRIAWIKVIDGSEEYEIGRYATPYGNDWCSWTINVSDYRELLTGNVELSSYIETWSNGWYLTVDFDFWGGTPTYPYVDVKNLWVDDFMIYGDTIFYSLDLPTRTVQIPSNAEMVKLRVVNTGHGQGNSENAAEFSQKTHDINVNGNNAFQQFLWKNDCGANPCSPQGGTWTLSRAGWCPGQDVTPYDYDLTSLVTTGQNATIDYVLQPYFNECSPWNPTCISGSTCNNCNYDGNQHTQPNYKMSVQLIAFSSTPIAITGLESVGQEESIKLYPSPSNGHLELRADLANSTNLVINVNDLSGRMVHHTALNQIQRGTSALDLSHLPDGLYVVQMEGSGQRYTQKILIAHQ